MRSLQEIEQLFASAAENGLTSAAVAQSVQRFGVNKLTPLPREPLWKKFLEKFDEPIIKILLGAALLSMFVDLFQSRPSLAGIALVVVSVIISAAFARRKGQWVPSILFVSAIVVFFVGLIAAGHPSVEGLAVMVAVILATGVAFLSEYKSDREFEVLNAQKESLSIKVIRDGAIHTVSLEDVCVGDAVVLEVGDEIPADGRLVKATDLYVDQSLMTGESEPARKKPQPLSESADGPDQPGCLCRGTQVVDGVGQMLVTEVGDATTLGQIARRLSAEDEEEDEASGVASAPRGAPRGADATPLAKEKRVKRKLTISKEMTPLQVKLKNLADLISNVGYIAAVAIFIALLGRGLYTHDVRWYPERPAPRVADEDDNTEPPLESRGQALLASSKEVLNYFVYMVIIIVVAVPEGLPMSVTVSLALAMRKMTRANSLVRQLVACETIGSATVICSDKTGTLTQNKMQVVRVFWDGQVHDRGSPQWSSVRRAGGVSPLIFHPGENQGANAPRSPLDWIVLNAAINSTANLEDKQGKLVTVGNSTEGALLQWLHEAGLEYPKLRLQFEPRYQIHFSSERKRMTTVIEYGDRLVSLVKGAPEWVLEHSTHYQAADGTVCEWTAQARGAVQESLKDSASQAMRTLGFGYSVQPMGTPSDEDALHARRDALESGLVFAGFLAIRDPLRDDVKDAVEQCRRSGIEVKMITGDNVETARAIAYDIGLLNRRDAPIDTPDAVVLTSPKFNELHAQLMELKKGGETAESDTRQRETLTRQLAGLRVLARARPLDKYKMVELLQEQQQVVAVTGDGTNDAPALKKADVGLAMGIAGTEVAKEASKIVLLDDAFSTIVKAVHWGRSLYENIQRFIQFQLTINVSALTIAFLGPFFGVRPPFTVLQLLWINVIMDTFASIALCSEPPRPGLMNLPPKRKDENIVTPAMVRTIFTTAVFFVVTMMVLLIGMEHFGWFAAGSGPNPEDWDFAPLNIRQVSIFFTVYVFFQVWNQINCRSLTPEASGLSGMRNNPTFLTIAGTVAVVQVLIISTPGLGRIFKVEPLSLVDWLGILAGTASVLLFAEIVRRIRLAMSSPARQAGKG